VIAIYVNDFLLFSGRIDNITVIKGELSKHFEMKDLGEAKWILQMKIERTNMNRDVRKLTISQEQYIKTILKQHGIIDCKSAKTPMVANLQLSTLTEVEIDITDYQRCIRSLMYLIVCICPDIAYSVGVLSRHIACPGKTHMQAVKHIFQYLHRTSHYRLEFQANNPNSTPLVVYVDLDWAGDHMDRKSISGLAVLLDGEAIS